MAGPILDNQPEVIMLRSRKYTVYAMLAALMGFAAAAALADSSTPKAALVDQASIVVHESNGKSTVRLVTPAASACPLAIRDP